MTADAEQTVIRFLDLFHASPPDATAIAACLSSDALYFGRVRHAEPLRGRVAIESELRNQFTRYRDCECEILSIASTPRQVFTERRDTVTMRSDGRKVTVLVCAVFDLDQSERIYSWKEYWDMKDIENQLS
jgi:limonene-1,2-epoxide hydrolase